MSYSQGQEEEAILKAFGDKKDGRFLDIGAYDGKTFSNTLALAERGWTGVCVEPSPHAFRRLQETYKGRSDIDLVCVAVDAGNFGIRKFHDTDDLVGSLDEEHVTKWSKQVKDYRDIWVQVVNMSMLLEAFPLPYDFGNIDVEGKNIYVAKAFLELCEKRGHLPKVLCIEHDGNNIELSNRGRALGYASCYLDGNNIILAR